MRRLPIALLLVLALVLGPLAPLQAGWACPDGTPCVAERGHGYRCAAGACAVASCCISRQTVRCRHGALPGREAGAGRGPRLQGADHCRYQVSARPSRSALLDGRGVHLSFSADLDFAPGAPSVPSGFITSLAWIEDTCGYRPPPLPSTGPARAPPFS